MGWADAGVTEGIIGVPEGGAGGAGQGVLSGAAAGAAGLEAAASDFASIAVMDRCQRDWHLKTAVLRALGN